MQNNEETCWLFNGKPFTSEDIGKHFGFVYIIRNKQTGRKYIGRKYFWSIRKVKGKTRRQRFESDWKEYYGSSEDLNRDVEILGKQAFIRQIMSLHLTRGGTNYEEVKQQYIHEVLESDDYYNTSIGGKYQTVKSKDMIKASILI